MQCERDLGEPAKFVPGMDVLRIGDVGAGAERPAGAGDHQGSQFGISSGVAQRVGQLLPQPGVDRVLAVGPVQCQGPDPVAVGRQ